MYIERAGFKVVVKMDFAEFINQPVYQRVLWKQNYIFVRECETPGNSVLFSRPGMQDCLMKLSYGYNILKDRHFDCIAPYPMHPLQYHYYESSKIQDQRKLQKRSIKVLFSGSSKASHYEKTRVKKFFNVLPRVEVLQFIIDHFEDHTISLMDEPDRLTIEKLHSYNLADKILVNERKSDPADWLSILSEAQFFICPPGARMPWCHNSVEAMAAGTIPILEYGHLFSPVLEHNYNCLRYSTFEELQDILNTALTMDDANIARMRQNVLNYYDKYLSIDSVVKKIEILCNSPEKHVQLAIPFIPTAEERRSIPDKVSANVQ